MTDRRVRITAVCAVLLVAAVAAVCSFVHMYELALAHGEAWRSSIIPMSVDGMLVAATLAIVDRRRHGHPAGWVPWLGLVLGIVASLLANVAAARPELIAQLVAAWPPLALAVSVETLVVVLRVRTEPAPDVSSEPENVTQRPQALIAQSAVRREPKRRRAQPDLKGRAAALLDETPGMGRTQLANALKVSTHQARVLLEELRPVNA